MMFVVMFVYLLSPYLVFLFSLRTWSCPHVCFSLLPVSSTCLSPSRHCYLTSCLILIVSCSPCVVFSFASAVSSVRFVSAVFPPSLPPYRLCIYVLSLPLILAVLSAHTVWFYIFCNFHVSMFCSFHFLVPSFFPVRVLF